MSKLKAKDFEGTLFLDDKDIISFTGLNKTFSGNDSTQNLMTCYTLRNILRPIGKLEDTYVIKYDELDGKKRIVITREMDNG